VITFKKIEKYISEFQKIEKNYMDVANYLSHKHAKKIMFEYFPFWATQN
jgi:hypothetical protein